MSSAALLLRQAEARIGFSSLEELFVDPMGFGIETASPLQRAICRALEGEPLGPLWDDPEVRAAFGETPPHPSRPREICIVSGIRTGKSLLMACTAVYASQKCDLTGLGAGEIPRFSIVSLNTDLARVVFGHIEGNIRESSWLRGLLIGDPTSDSLLIRHPSGRPVEIKVVAGSRSGATLVARWSVGAIFDEAPRMCGEESGVVNLADMRTAALYRVRPGGIIAYIGSPWGPEGPVYDMLKEHFGKGSPGIVCVKAPAPVMNPALWPPEVVEAARRFDPDAARTEIDAEFADPSSNLFPLQLIERYTRQAPVERAPTEGAEYVAAMDPATRGNAWTLVVATKMGGRCIVCVARQWIGSRFDPLSPRVVLTEIRDLLASYRLSWVMSDQWQEDALRDIAVELGLNILRQEAVAGRTQWDLYKNLQTLLSAGLVEFPPDAQFARDLTSVRRKVTAKGQASVMLPQTSDGRHADYAPAVTLAFSRYMEEPRTPKPQATDGLDPYDAEDEELEAAAEYDPDVESDSIDDFFG